MRDDQISELFDTDLVRCWNLDEDGNAIEEDVVLAIPEIDVDYGDCYGMSMPFCGIPENGMGIPF